jgi:uncharacterized membrane protein
MSKPFSWSYSALKNYETCPKRHYHYDVIKDVKEPESPQLREGHLLHQAFQNRVSKNIELPPNMARFEPMLANIQTADGTTYTEQKLALTSTFQPSEYFGGNVWFRTVLDVAKVRDDGVATVLDYKTGKVTEDLTQLQLMSMTLFAHMPKVQTVHAALAFVNYDYVDGKAYTRSDITPVWSGILPRVRALEKARAMQEFPPQPSGLCRRFCGVVSCPYHGRGG